MINRKINRDRGFCGRCRSGDSEFCRVFRAAESVVAAARLAVCRLSLFSYVGLARAPVLQWNAASHRHRHCSSILQRTVPRICAADIAT